LKKRKTVLRIRFDFIPFLIALSGLAMGLVSSLVIPHWGDTAVKIALFMFGSVFFYLIILVFSRLGGIFLSQRQPAKLLTYPPKSKSSHSSDQNDSNGGRGMRNHPHPRSPQRPPRMTVHS
jgi:hypothetical protein